MIPELGPTVVPPPILIPPLAVTIPIESTFVTSSYVNTPVNVAEVPTNPLGKLTAPFAPAFVIVPARIRPPVALLTALGKVDVFIPKTSGIKVSPSATIKSASSLTTIS